MLVEKYNERWWSGGKKMEIVDQLVHADLLLKRHGINISSIAEDPLSVYMSKKCKTKEVGLMAETKSLCLCPLCTIVLWKM